jgi:hypothetical protein
MGRIHASDFEAAVQRTLRAVYRRKIGRALLDWILSQRARLLEIRPPPTGYSTESMPRARVRGGAPPDEALSTQPGQGAVHVLLEVHPKDFGGRDVYQATIIHELSHVVRWMSGTREPTNSVANYGNIEEYYGELLANMFWSELGLPFPYSFGYSGGTLRISSAVSDRFWDQALLAVRGPAHGSAATTAPGAISPRDGQGQPAVVLNATQMRSISDLVKNDQLHGPRFSGLRGRFPGAFPPLGTVQCAFNPFL